MNQFGGPHDYWSSEKPPSRGQWRHIAELACRVLRIPVPRSRFEASVTVARLRAAEAENPPEVPAEPWGDDAQQG